MTFAALHDDFKDRMAEVDLFFSMLESIENNKIAIVDESDSTTGLPSEWITLLKATAYLMIYNLVEAFLRRGFQEVFDTIKSEHVSYLDLSEKFIAQCIMQKNRKVKAFDGSPKVYMEIAHKIVKDINDKTPVTLNHQQLPISGNLDAETVRDVCILHGIDHNTDPAAKGGVSLHNVKLKRNNLAHGIESFVEVGRDVTVGELVQIKAEAFAFMQSILANIEVFVKSKLYLANKPLP